MEKKLIRDNELGRKGERIKDIFCPICDGKTSHEIVSHIKIDTQDEEYPESEGIIEIVYFAQILVCKKCKMTSLRNAQVEKNGNDSNETARAPQLFPPRKDKGYDKKFTGSGGVFRESHKILELYKECIDAYSQEMNFSAGAAIRSLLEEICKDRGHKNKVIQELESEMAEKKANPRYNELELDEKLEILTQFHAFKGSTFVEEFDEILKENNRVKRVLRDTILSEKEKKTAEIKASLSKQIVFLKEELQSKRPNSIELSILNEVVDWGNGTIHGFTIPSNRKVKSALMIVEFIFHALYVDEVEEASFSKYSTEFIKSEDDN